MSTNLLLTGARQSRFVSRWLAADAARENAVAQLSGLSLADIDLDQLLSTELARGAAGSTIGAALRRVRGLLFAAIVERDVGGQADLAEVLAAISRFADFAVQKALADQHAAMCELHGVPIGEESGRPQQMIVIGMGKLGGHELNVSSDIDLIFLYPEGGDTRTERDDQRPLSNHEFFVRLGKRLIAQLAEITEDGYCFRVDMALRPNGASGPLAASFAMLEEYLLVQGREWERYAWVKARAMTGDAEDIAYLDKLVQPFVYRRYLDYGAIHALRGMHAQIRAEVVRQETRHPGRVWNVKLGRGGIREVEFITQVFQLIRGGRDPSLRDRSTRSTLKTVAAKKLMAPETVERLLASYTFLRNIEHRIQYLDDAQSHVLPAADEDQARIATMAGFADAEAMKQSITECCTWVAAQFDAIFEDKAVPVNEATSATPAPALEEVDEATLVQYLDALGYDEPSACASRLLSSWRSSRIQAMPLDRKQQLQALMRHALPEIARQDGSRTQTLNRVVDFFEAIARRSAYLSLLTEFPQALARVVRMMAASDWAARYLIRHPVLMDELLDDRSLNAEPDWKAFGHECEQRLAAFAGDTERQMDVLRELHHAQLFRLLAQDLGGVLTVERLADHLSALADVLVGATLSAVWQMLPNRHREVPAFAVIAYGKLGGKELGYASDLDVIFLYDDDDQDAPALYAKLAQRFITWMTSHTPAGILFDIDIALRPDGASGLLVSSLASFEKYQRSSAWVWEHQALTRARFCAGDPQIGQRFEQLRITMLRQARDRDALKQEVLAMRKRMHDAHPNRSDKFDLKHDPGGMIDIEFVVQYLVLAHACDVVALTGDIGNIALLKLAGDIGLIDRALSVQVADAYRAFRKLQHQIRLRGEDKARVELAQVEAEANAVKKLWERVLG